MLIATPTITHTGTRFLHRRIFRVPELFKVYTPTRIAQRDRNKPAIYHVHMLDHLRNNWLDIINWNLPVVIPLVHPARNRISCKRYNHADKQFYQQWENMMVLCSHCQPLFLHLDDLTCRDKEAWKIVDTYHLPKVIDWTPKKTSGAVHGTDKIQLATEHLKGVPQKFIDFYEQTKLTYREVA